MLLNRSHLLFTVVTALRDPPHFFIWLSSQEQQCFRGTLPLPLWTADEAVGGGQSLEERMCTSHTRVLCKDHHLWGWISLQLTSLFLAIFPLSQLKNLFREQFSQSSCLAEPRGKVKIWAFPLCDFEPPTRNSWKSNFFGLWRKSNYNLP